MPTTATIVPAKETRRIQEKILAMNEALMLGSVRQHELAEAADEANTRMQAEIAERVLAEAALRRAQAQLTEHAHQLEIQVAKYADLYDFAPVGYLTIDGGGTIRGANLAIASLLGIPRSDLLNRPFAPLIAPADGPVFDAFFKNVFGHETLQECDVTLVVDGKAPIEVRMEAHVLGEGHDCRIAVTDITERKRVEADRLILNKLGSVGILAGGIAHDFNNLLTVILLNLELAQLDTPPDAGVAAYLEEARGSTLLARGLTAQLLTFATGGAPVRRPTRLAALIHESVRPVLGGTDVRCEYALADNLWTAEIDAGQIGQVIRNLVMNACEAMPRGGVVTVKAENVALGSHAEPALPPGDYVRLSVSDQGPGIAREVLPKIFDPYFSTKQMGNQKGMGLGLTICHAVVQKHGGAIVARPRAGVGTTFHVFLPAVPEVDAGDAGALSGPQPWHGRLLIMDDDEPVRKLVGLILESMGQTVELAEHGQMAVARYEDAKNHGRPFDLVILDLMVRGGMGGVDTIRVLRGIDPAVKAIAMSGYVEDPVILDPARYGFAGALAKPFDRATVAAVLAQVMGPAVKDSRAGPSGSPRC